MSLILCEHGNYSLICSECLEETPSINEEEEEAI